MRKFDVLIVGTGHGGAQAAIQLRQLGFAGSIGMIGREAELPYERPPCRRTLAAEGFRAMLIRPPAFWPSAASKCGAARVVAGDPGRGRLACANGGDGYGRLVWASGGVRRASPARGRERAHFSDRADGRPAPGGAVRRGAGAVLGFYILAGTAAVLRRLARVVLVASSAACSRASPRTLRAFSARTGLRRRRSGSAPPSPRSKRTLCVRAARRSPFYLVIAGTASRRRRALAVVRS